MVLFPLNLETPAVAATTSALELAALGLDVPIAQINVSTLTKH